MSAVPVAPQALQDPAESIQFPLLKNGANLTPGLRALSTWSGACETGEGEMVHLVQQENREDSTMVFSCKRTFFYILL